jgi:hypothetical protein
MNWAGKPEPEEAAPVSEYRTSWYGRFGYLTMAVAAFMLIALLALPFQADSLSPRPPVPLPVKVLAGLFLCLLGWLFLLCTRRGLGPGERLRTYPKGFVYRGLLRAVRVRWADIDSYRLGYGGRSPFLFLHVTLKDESQLRRRKLKLDVSGLSPESKQLTEEFLRQTGLKPKSSSIY